MPLLTQCPQCATRVIYSPAKPDLGTAVSCPSCQAEFPLSEALEKLSEELPELKSASLLEDAVPTGQSSIMASAAVAELLSKMGERTNLHGKKKAAKSDDDVKIGGDEIKVSPSEERLDLVDDSEPIDDESSVQELDDLETSEDEEEGLAARARRRQPKKGSMIRTMVGVVLGGVMGIGGGLIIIKLIKGKDFDLPIPFLSQLDLSPVWSMFSSKASTETPPEDLGLVAPPQGTAPGAWWVGTAEPTPPAVAEATPDMPEVPAPDATVAATTPPAAVGGETLLGQRGTKGFVASDVDDVLGPIYSDLQPGLGEEAITPRMTDTLYKQLAEAGGRVAQLKADVPAASAAACKNEMKQLLGRVAVGQKNLDIISGLAMEQLAKSQRDSNGILLAGVVRKVGQRGKFKSIELEPARSAPRILVLTTEAHGMRIGDAAVISGTIVDAPAANLKGFGGDANQVILSAALMSVTP